MSEEEEEALTARDVVDGAAGDGFVEDDEVFRAGRQRLQIWRVSLLKV